MGKLPVSEINKRLQSLSEWSLEDDQITRSFSFGSFMDAITFVEKVAHIAEDHDHHPDIDIRYSTVKISVSSHDAGGITERDFRLVNSVSKTFD